MNASIAEEPLDKTIPPERPVRVLVVDDDVEFTRLVAEFLQAEASFEVAARHDGAAGVEAARGSEHDIIVLDVGLPRMNGFDALRAIRRDVATPVIMLTARGDDIDRILGLESGADDYISKPCNLRELAARIRAVLRRSSRAAESGASAPGITVEDLRIEPGSQSVYIGGELIAVTATEFLVLEALVTLAGEVVPKDSIARQALGRRILPYDRSVDVHIGNLRKKLGPLRDGRQRIKTVRGRGYLYVTLS
jgi:two-component system, OmpR family, response regulator CpxR